MLTWDAIPLLQKAAHNVGGWAIRNMATVGGNLFAPPPAGDFAVALLALDAQVVLTSAAGQRVVSLNDFYTGFMTTVVQPGELVSEIRVPAPAGQTAYLKFARRETNTPSIVTVAAHIMRDGDRVTDARLALNGVGPHPFRARRAESRWSAQRWTRQPSPTPASWRPKPAIRWTTRSPAPGIAAR